MGGSQIRIGSSELRIQGNGLLEEVPRLRIILRGEAAIELCPAHEELPGLWTRRVCASHVSFLRYREPNLERPSDHPGNFLLHGEHVFQVLVARLSQHVTAR